MEFGIFGRLKRFCSGPSELQIRKTELIQRFVVQNNRANSADLSYHVTGETLFDYVYVEVAPFGTHKVLRDASKKAGVFMSDLYWVGTLESLCMPEHVIVNFLDKKEARFYEGKDRALGLTQDE